MPVAALFAVGQTLSIVGKDGGIHDPDCGHEERPAEPSRPGSADSVVCCVVCRRWFV